MKDHHGQYYTLENARLYTLPEQPVPIYVSGFGPKAAELAGRVGDGYISTKPDPDLLAAFRSGGGQGKPTQAGYKVCWDTHAKRAQQTAHRLADLEYTTAAFTHGPEIRLTAREEIRGFLARQPVPQD